MATKERGIFVYRPLSPDSLTMLKALQSEYSCVDTFRPVANLHLSLLQGNAWLGLKGSSREKILSEGPDTTFESYDMRIASAQLHPGSRRLSQFAIALMLNNEDGHYNNEHKTFRNLAADKTGKYSFVARNPHVTIGYMRPEFALQSVLQPAEALIGQSLSFDPIESNLGNAAKKQARTDATASSPILVPVQTHQPGAIPSNFLASLRPRNLDPEDT